MSDNIKTACMSFAVGCSKRGYVPSIWRMHFTSLSTIIKVLIIFCLNECPQPENQGGESDKELWEMLMRLVSGLFMLQFCFPFAGLMLGLRLFQKADTKSLLHEFDAVISKHVLMEADEFNDDQIYKFCLNQVRCFHLWVIHTLIAFCLSASLLYLVLLMQVQQQVRFVSWICLLDLSLQELMLTTHWPGSGHEGRRSKEARYCHDHAVSRHCLDCRS